MKVLVTGGSGLLGRHLARCVPDGVDAAFTWYTVHQPWCLHQMDVTDASQVGYVFGRFRPDAVVHMAAEGGVDRCEREYTVAERTNVDGTRNVLQAARERRARVLLTSTNAVFSGDDPPYRPDSERRPINVYGRLRKRCEDLVAGHPHGWQVARLFLLYGWEPEGARGNWASTVVRKLRRGEPLRVVRDAHYMPTYAADAAEAVWALLLDGRRDAAFHVAGDAACSLYEFAREAAGAFGLDAGCVIPAKLSQFPDIAPRPRDTSYDPAELVACRDFAEGLRAMRDEEGR